MTTARKTTADEKVESAVEAKKDSTSNSTDTSGGNFGLGPSESDLEDQKKAQDERQVVKDPDGDYVYPDGVVAQPLTVPPETYTDSRGVERLAGGFDDGWEPAPVEPDPELVARQEARQKQIEDKASERDERLKAQVSELEKAQS